MPLIPNFPRSLLEEHRAWHHARMSIDISNPPPGYGIAFLEFHRHFIRRALEWYRGQGLDERLVQPWLSVPEPIRLSPCYNRSAEARIIRMPQTFASADELGRFIESSNLHACIHQQSALLYGEPELNDFDLAPRSTVFYQIHGMIDNWYRAWEAAAVRGGSVRTTAAAYGRRNNRTEAKWRTNRLSRVRRQGASPRRRAAARILRLSAPGRALRAGRSARMRSLHRSRLYLPAAAETDTTERPNVNRTRR